MHMKRKAALVISALALGVVGFAGLGPAAQATDDPIEPTASELTVEVIDSRADAAGRCANNRLCLYEHDDFRGLALRIIMPSPGVCGNLPPEYRNMASSQQNEYNRTIKFYAKTNCSGSSGYKALAESEDKDLTNNGFDNKTDSLR
ncbi:peptidase inhibitor family I36 protein [Nonomuraea sp. NPDC059007]|uniref:peptidase inhibitor family I36 protein n=1 Tax=Nonomuraea sp. NPDC059007 TaxID=3346692 RepID=UPI00367FABC6